ncbi:hypothetical protein QQZ08_002327 [Neonectria magnoliae]|uniref:Uncharacterized protein n=1 Tax=Neonectria magnoliae TaxID=2732573 RepID=A0ABR1IDL0_9HYPO
MPEVPWSVEFQIELQVLLAANKFFMGHEFSRTGFLPFTGKQIPVPLMAFSHVPPKLSRHAGYPSSEEKYKGWVLSAVAYSLSRKELATNWAMPEDAPLPESFEKFFGSEVWMQPRDASDFDSNTVWKISYDQDINERENPDFSFVGVKITSPMYSRDATTGLSPLEGLTEVISTLTEDHITISNAETRLGVSVKQKGGTLAFKAVKSIASLLWVADPLLNEIHPPHCGPGSLESLGLQFTNLAENHDHVDVAVELASADTMEDPWNNRLSGDRPPLSLLPHPGELTDPRFAHGLGRIQSTKGLPELVHLLRLVPITHTKRHSRPRPAYDFQGLEARNASDMIKFNQHCGTLDFEAISHWASVCTHLVSFGIEKTPERILEKLTILRQQLQDRSISLFDSLASRGLEDTAEYYRKMTWATRIPELRTWPELKKGVSNPESEPNAIPLDMDRTKGIPFLDDLGEKLNIWESSAKTTENDCYTIGIELEMLTPSSGETEEEKADRVKRMERLNRVHFPGHESDKDIKFQRTDPKTKPWEDPDPSDGRSCVQGIWPHTRYPQIAEIMGNKLGLFAICDFTLRELSSSCSNTALNQFFAMKGGIYIEPDYDSEWQAWSVRTDGSLRALLDWKGYKSADGVEIVSPILRDRPEGWETILNVLVGLRQELRLVVDEGCGVHFNVGKGLEPMPFHLLRKLICLMYCADPVIFSLCNPERRCKIGYAHPLRDGSGLLGEYEEAWTNLPITPDFAQYMPVEQLSLADCAALKKIWMAPDFESLHYLVAPRGNRNCVSINRIKAIEIPGSFSGAVEFRHLEGSLDPDLILRFGQLLTTLFRFADKAEPKAWQGLVRSLMLCRGPDRYDLDILRVFLEQLGLHDDFSYWESIVRNNRDLPRARAPPDGSSLHVLPAVPPQHVESDLRNICRRQIKPDLKGQLSSHEEIKPPQTVHAGETIKARARSLLQIISPNDPLLQDNLEHTLAGATEVKESLRNYREQRLPDLEASLRELELGVPTQEKPEKNGEAREGCSRASRERDNLADILLQSQEKARKIYVQELSQEELNVFARLGRFHKDEQDFLDIFPRVVGPRMEVMVTEEDWERFLDD